MSKSKKKDEELTTYKVRCAITMAHYRFVEAHDQDEAERIVDDYIRNYRLRKHETADGGFCMNEEFDWDSEASHYHVTYEVEEAE